MKVSIFGNGFHRIRYFDALAFNPQVENIQCEKMLSECLDSDLIIISEPLLLKSNKLIFLKDINIPIIIEKIPETNYDNTMRLLSELKNQQIFFVHSRLYEQRHKFLTNTIDNTFSIVWPNDFGSGMHPIYNTLPNILDFCSHQFGIDVFNCEVLCLQRSIYGMFRIQDKHFTINFKIVPVEVQPFVSINDIPMSWPNYLDLYTSAMSSAMKITPKSIDLNHQYLLNEMKIITRMTKETLL